MSENLLVNPTFGGDYSMRDGASQLYVASGWTFGYDRALFRPEMKPWFGDGYSGQGVVIGDRCQKGFNFSSRGHWWLGQMVPAVKGQWYRGKVCVYTWSSDGNDGAVSVSPGKCWVRCGIHPWGELLPFSWSTQYGTALVDQYDHWHTYEVYAQAQANRVAFLIEVMNEHPARHNDWLIDAASLTECAAPGEEPPTPPPPSGEVDYARIKADVRAAMREVVNETRLVA